MPDAPLIIVSGPSGSGKSTIISQLRTCCALPLRLSVSATTREPRKDEVNGNDYHFWNREQFQQAIDRGDFLEWALVHGNYYGTLASEVDPFLKQGIGVILDIDVQGAVVVRELRPDHLSVFIEVPEGRYEERLRGRATESEESIQCRLARAGDELTHAAEYHVRLINDHLDETVSALKHIIEDRFTRS